MDLTLINSYVLLVFARPSNTNVQIIYFGEDITILLELNKSDNSKCLKQSLIDK